MKTENELLAEAIGRSYDIDLTTEYEADESNRSIIKNQLRLRALAESEIASTILGYGGNYWLRAWLLDLIDDRYCEQLLGMDLAAGLIDVDDWNNMILMIESCKKTTE